MIRSVLAILLLLPAPALAAVRVVATVPDLAAIAAAVVGEHGKVTALAQPGQDPHFVDARPSMALELAKADLLVVNGLDLELGWLPTLLTGARNPRIQPGAAGYLDASAYVTVLQVPLVQVDRSMGDVHPGGNPHFTSDPRAAAALAPALAIRLGDLDRDHAAAYAENAARFVASVSEAQSRWEARAAALRGQPVIDFHRSLPYLEDWLGFEIVDDIEPKPGIPPTPKHLLHVIETGRSRSVRLVLQESWFPANVSHTVADEVGARVAVIPGQTNFQGGQAFVAHLDEVIALLVGDAP